MTLRLQSIDELPPALREQARWQIGRDVPAAPADEPKRRSKMGNTRTMLDGQWFDSKLEARCYEWLRERQQRGEVAWFIRQPPFRLEGNVIYRADFLVVLAAGGVEVIDAKGYDTQVSRNKRKQVKARYGVEVLLWPTQKLKA